MASKPRKLGEVNGSNTKPVLGNDFPGPGYNGGSKGKLSERKVFRQGATGGSGNNPFTGLESKIVGCKHYNKI